MDKSVMFNARLRKTEIDTWLNLLDSTSETGARNRHLAERFLLLSESITFVSSVESRIIGGTSIYKDRRRSAMVLASAAVSEDYRESAAFQIIKSSLPFFKTVAIRDVDVLVPQNDETNKLGFPLSFDLEPWTKDIIQRIGFSEVGVLKHCSFLVEPDSSDKPIVWDKQINEEESNELIWDQSEPMGLTNSLVWLARDFALANRSLEALTVDEHIVAVAGFWKIDDTLCVLPLVSDPLRIGWEDLATKLLNEVQRRKTRYMDLSLLGGGQQDLIQALEEFCSLTSCRKLSLLRKQL
jgi:hypothetical protein